MIAAERASATGFPVLDPGRRKIHRVAPPLQADLASHGLRNERRDVVQLSIKGIKREKGRPIGSWREQGAPIAVAIPLPDKSCCGLLVKFSLSCVVRDQQRRSKSRDNPEITTP